MSTFHPDALPGNSLLSATRQEEPASNMNPVPLEGDTPESRSKYRGVQLWTVFLILCNVMLSTVFAYPENLVVIAVGSVLLGFQFCLMRWAFVLNTIVCWLWAGLFGLMFLIGMASPENVKFGMAIARPFLPISVITAVQTSACVYVFRAKGRRR